MHQFLEALVISKRIISLLTLANLWVFPQKHSITSAIRIMVEKILVCSYIEHLEDDLVLRNLKIGILGLRYKDVDCLAYPQAGFLIALFQTLAVLVVL